MFSFPVTIPYRTDTSVECLPAMVDIDEVAVVQPLLDKKGGSGVTYEPFSSLIPQTEIVLVDGRRIPVVECSDTINRYLDVYRQLEGFYTGRAATVEAPREGNVIPLFQGGQCATSEGSIPA